MRKTVEINDYKFDALIDTGIAVTLVRYSVYANLGMPTLNPTKIKLSAFGKGSKMKTKDDEIIIQLLNDENTERLMQESEEMRHHAK
ncbi:hypothetical protein TNCV_4489781 [Trichonephila clavipes]|nr:hypothetical protein TNCV_4489781 [Trichonephila clavipes]